MSGTEQAENVPLEELTPEDATKAVMSGYSHYMNNALAGVSDVVEVRTLRAMTNWLFEYEPETEGLDQKEAIKKTAQGVVALVRDNLREELTLPPEVEEPEEVLFQLID